MKLWWDLETYSETRIKDGTHRYAEKAEILLFSWAIDDGPVYVWDVTETSEIPLELGNALICQAEYWGHNSGNFDSTIIKWNPYLRAYFRPERHRDTLVQALCHGLPGSLGALCEIFRLGTNVAKDKRGKKLIQMFCQPRPANSKIRRFTRETHPQEWEEFKEYAKSDIRAMRELHKKMPKWNYPNNPQELALWQLDQKINQEGIYVDLDLAEKAIRAVDAEQARLAGRTHEATDGVVSSATQRDALLGYILAEHGVSLPDMRSDTLERRLADESLPESVREIIAIRLAASTSSVSKYKRVLRSTSSDGYLRGVIQFSGAGRTGRDAGRLFQPQNLLRPTLKQEDIDFGIEAIKAGCADLITSNMMELCANTMRGVIIAPPKHKIVVADLSNIEGRVLAWLFQEQWKLDAFDAYDRGEGPDLYLASYARAFGVPIETAKRQVGKVLELAMGFGGGVGSFITFAAVYRLDLEEMTAGLSLPTHVVREAENFWEWSKDTKRSTYGLPREVFVACDSLKRLWRAAHPKISAGWKETEEAVRSALYGDGESFTAGRVRWFKQGNWIRGELPSTRCLSYVNVRDEDGLSYMGINQYSRKWSRLRTYGGKLVENMTQAVARDVFKNCYPAAIEAGYSIRLPVHDELVTYAPDQDHYNENELARIMSIAPRWAKGIPLAAAGYQGYRYRKD
jgi:DNA polymerase